MWKHDDFVTDHKIFAILSLPTESAMDYLCMYTPIAVM